ncbi:PadR family transcriptional regulator [Nocardia sp. NEAU-351]|uniref:PadR family transcriptional regulator n=2 Tax=Nocardia bovistercoris TaxID=2785916 RepID=A0A931N1D6_9NOCA|nr:PadR family transcriptional regulator [Nocardia bovistercoris]MBH0775864.1 PadR family transcriptional regulator [Nocardia bovistercoris]
MGQRPQVTALAVAVLALLEERPMHPYEMYQLLLSRGDDLLVKVSAGSLYHTVARLADQELVFAEGVDREGNRPERTTYRLTERGHETLRARLAEVLRFPHAEYPIFPLALAEAHNLPREDVVALLRERLRFLRVDIEDLDRMAEWAAAHMVPRRYWVVVPYLRATLGSQVAWLEQFVIDLESGALDWEEFDPLTGLRVSGPEHPWAESDSAVPPPVRRRAAPL